MFEGEGEVAVFCAKRWDSRSNEALTESMTPYHEAQVVGPYWVSNPLRLTVQTAKSEDYTSVPQHLYVCVERSEEILVHQLNSSLASPILEGRTTINEF